MIHINKVSELTGVTVRTLRYYDKIGLLKPASKTEGGHRLYTDEEIKTLQQIQFLKKIGFTLDEIKNMLSSSEWNWSDSLKSQLFYVVKEQENLKEIESSLRELLNGLAIEGEQNWLAIQKIMRLSNKDKKMKQDYRESLFKGTEKLLWDKLPNLGSDSPNTLEWVALIGQIKGCIKDGPGAPRVQNIIRRMEEKRMEDFDGEDVFINKLWDMRMSPTESEKLGLYPIEQEVLEFLELAYAIFADADSNADPKEIIE